jgi:hypothetical protein
MSATVNQVQVNFGIGISNTAKLKELLLAENQKQRVAMQTCSGVPRGRI